MSDVYGGHPVTTHPATGEEMLSVDAAATLLDIDRRAIYNACRDGDIPGAVKPPYTGKGRWWIPRSGLDAWVAAQWTTASGQ